MSDFNSPIAREIRRLSLEIAITKYDYQELIFSGVPPALCSETANKLAVLNVQKFALITGRFEELPYNIKLLYSNEDKNKVTTD